jgi:hypothetical protein
MRQIAIVLALASVACGPAFSTAAETELLNPPQADDGGAKLVKPPLALIAASPPPVQADAGSATEADSAPLMTVDASPAPAADSQPTIAPDAAMTETYVGVTCNVTLSAGNSACQNHGGTPAWTCSRNVPADTGVALPDPTMGGPRPADLPAACWANYVDVGAGSGVSEYAYCC